MQSASKDSFWKFIERFEGGNAGLYRRQAREAGYDLAQSAKGDQVRKCLARMQRGLLCYETCSTPELEKFLEARNIHQHPEKLSRGGMIKRLMSADDDRDFPRFMDLPPELRNSVYEFVMDEYAKTLITPAQPPFALVSRQVRDEALSTFYACCSFQIDL
ncbi:uncharacterized protein MYCFIDRAFT_195118 [Pseudocercospora fijiensis CIRAD86]|uniref:Uncharacterized protein n=1 Tax=Pseudocercospora fijiensis (strain CIRAD86) TaxID=383855 RepID=M2Z269_PSEFD|nr:uncharacterized protein MYCFIDRAFT_195118 [Pseudocercospora fijiensis CIRAD86]EME83920.1 hypothetical protein MYCFIDRAFT_195118 [Pseudocercospora fijiensis CIRAD86]